MQDVSRRLTTGTGKTSTVLALARRLYGPPYRKHILELNASDDRGIDVVREQIKSFAMTKVLFSWVSVIFDFHPAKSRLLHPLSAPLRGTDVLEKDRESLTS